MNANGQIVREQNPPKCSKTMNTFIGISQCDQYLRQRVDIMQSSAMQPKRTQAPPSVHRVAR